MNLQELQQKKQKLEQELADPEVVYDPQKIKEIGSEFAKIKKQLELAEELDRIEKDIVENEKFMDEKDPELKFLAGEELTKLEKRKAELFKKESQEEDTPQGVIMEIRAGAGGNEAGLFAGELFEMYNAFAKKQEWRLSLLDESRNEVGGYKEVIFEVEGENVYKLLRWESGVHRVQRVPETEKIGRVHTSTASVAVLPQAREVDIEIKPQDIKVEFFRSSGPGGQNVNKVETAVRIYHLPTGLMVTCQESRSQQKNREKAMIVLRSRLLDAKLQEEAKKMATTRREQIGTADRSEKIRTYNFPQDRVTDHRIKQSWHNIPSIMAGNLEPVVERLQSGLEVKD